MVRHSYDSCLNFGHPVSSLPQRLACQDGFWFKKKIWVLDQSQAELKSKCKSSARIWIDNRSLTLLRVARSCLTRACKALKAHYWHEFWLSAVWVKCKWGKKRATYSWSKPKRRFSNMPLPPAKAPEIKCKCSSDCEWTVKGMWKGFCLFVSVSHHLINI